MHKAGFFAIFRVSGGDLPIFRDFTPLSENFDTPPEKNACAPMFGPNDFGIDVDQPERSFFGL